MRLLSASVGLLLFCPRFIAAAEPPPPFERTENRERCANYTATRQPFFGELHLHTQYSADAATLSTRNTPFDAYRYARGEKVGLPPFVDTRAVKVSDAQPATGGVSAYTKGCPGVSTTSAARPSRRNCDSTHSAARRTSPRCRESALTLGMRSSCAKSSSNDLRCAEMYSVTRFMSAIPGLPTGRTI